MQITCYACGSDIEIEPPHYRCSACDTDLEAFVEASNVLAFELQDPIARYYRQAADFAAKGSHEQALTVIQQGLAISNASQFHLLAALIHRRRREYDHMRQHIAAIPIDDVLRPEGEWLLRSHQQQQRAIREAARGKSDRNQQVSAGTFPHIGSDATGVSTVSPALNAGSARLRSWRLILPTLVLAIVVIGWQGSALYGQIAGIASKMTSSTLSWMQTHLESQAPPLTDDREPNAAPVTRFVVDPTATSMPTSAATATVVSVRPVAFTNAAEPDPPATSTPEPVAANSTVSAAIALTNRQQFDFASFLRLMKREDLAEFEIAARRIDDKLVLEGVVSSYVAREDILLLAQKLPGVAEVNGIDLVVRLPDVYVVQPADTLWAIAYELYGDGAHWTVLYQANQDRLNEDLLLSPGQELVVPSSP